MTGLFLMENERLLALFLHLNSQTKIELLVHAKQKNVIYKINSYALFFMKINMVNRLKKILVDV